MRCSYCGSTDCDAAMYDPEAAHAGMTIIDMEGRPMAGRRRVDLCRPQSKCHACGSWF